MVDYVRFDLEEAGKAMEELYGLGISGFGISITEDKEPVPKEMIDKAKSRLADLANASDDYREMFNRRNVEQMIST